MQSAQRIKAHSIGAALAVCLNAYPESIPFGYPSSGMKWSSFWNGNVIDTAMAPHPE